MKSHSGEPSQPFPVSDNPLSQTEALRLLPPPLPAGTQRGIVTFWVRSCFRRPAALCTSSLPGGLHGPPAGGGIPDVQPTCLRLGLRQPTQSSPLSSFWIPSIIWLQKGFSQAPQISVRIWLPTCIPFLPLLSLQVNLCQLLPASVQAGGEGAESFPQGRDLQREARPGQARPGPSSLLPWLVQQTLKPLKLVPLFGNKQRLERGGT